jgi:hypothetical protein
VSADVDGGKGADVVFGESEVYGVAFYACHGPDRDCDLLPAPHMAALKDEVRDVFVGVNYETVDLAE